MSCDLGKMAIAVLVAGVSTLAVGKISDALYQVGEQPAVRGFSIAVSEAVAAEAPAKAAAAAAPAAATAAAPAAAAAVDVAALIAAADAAKGKDLTKPCAACHSFDNGGANKIGPNLWGVAGSAIAAKSGFNYSADFKSKSAEKWTDENLFKLITKPKDFAKGTKMAFPGYKEPEKAAAVVKYLQSLK